MRKKILSVSKPPAEAPMPTIGKVSPVPSLMRSDFFFAGALLPGGEIFFFLGRAIGFSFCTLSEGIGLWLKHSAPYVNSGVFDIGRGDYRKPQQAVKIQLRF